MQKFWKLELLLQAHCAVELATVNFNWMELFGGTTSILFALVVCVENPVLSKMYSGELTITMLLVLALINSSNDPPTNPAPKVEIVTVNVEAVSSYIAVLGDVTVVEVPEVKNESDKPPPDTLAQAGTDPVKLRNCPLAPLETNPVAPAPV